MAVTSETARGAIYAEIIRQTERLKDSQYNEATEAAVVRDLALAFRYTLGGPQPGAVSVEK